MGRARHASRWAAVEREGTPIFLDTHLTNAVARYLLEAGRVPGLAGAKIIRAEAPVGRSRFDFLLEEGGRPMYLEVKSVTFFGGRVAMFPDAITARGRRHLIELAELSRAGTRTAVLFVVHHPDIDWFMPDYHTDLAFSKTFLAVRDAVEFHPVSVRWRRDLTLADKVKPVAIPWEYLEREVADRGAYILLLHLKRRRRVRVGELGVFTFPKGHYLYVGSAMRNLTARIARHERRRRETAALAHRLSSGGGGLVHGPAHPLFTPRGVRYRECLGRAVPVRPDRLRRLRLRLPGTPVLCGRRPARAAGFPRRATGLADASAGALCEQAGLIHDEAVFLKFAREIGFGDISVGDNALCVRVVRRVKTR